MVPQPNPKLLPYVTVAAVGALAALSWADVHYTDRFNAAVVYAPVLLACWWARSRIVLWTLFGLAAVSMVATQWFEEGDDRALRHRIFLLGGLLALAIVFDHLMRAWRRGIVRHQALEARNAELAAREEEIARQNEELQSQTEELERQSEELTTTNDELARRERSLGVLLELSRGLSIDMTRAESLARICQTLNTLLYGDSAATAILLREGDALRIACHCGFGPEGVRSDVIPLETSIASLITLHGRSGFIEDLSLRPELDVPQPKDGPPVVSVLSSPLMIAGKAVGTIEAYSFAPRTWTSEQVALVESVASQTAFTLRSDALYEEVLQERRKFEAVFRTAPVGIALIDAGSSVIRFNPSGAAMMGMPSDTSIEQSNFFQQVRIYRNGIEQDRLQTALSLETNQELTGQEADIVHSGRRLTILYSVAPIRDAAGRPISSVSAFVDVTMLKELQHELDARRREAEEASIRKSRFLAAISHDVRTPANAISLLAELIRRTASLPGRESEIVEMAAELHSSAMSLVSLMGDVLDITRFDAGRLELQEENFELRALLSRECQHLAPLAREKQLTFDFADGPEIWIHCDKIKLARVVGNLIGNAIKFTDSGQVRVDYGNHDGDGRVHVSVHDSGIGIAPEHVKVIFDEFFQLRNPERDRNKGNGLGLTICKRLADAMGAELQVTSEPGRGSRFSIILPASAVAARR